MTDLIDRWVAIDSLTDENLEHFLDSCYDSEMHRYKRAAQRIIGSLPSAEPHLVNESQGLVKDLVNREGALCSIEQYIDKFDCIDVNFLDGLKTAMQLIKELPSAEPQERTGKWIPCSKEMPPVGKTVLVTVKTDTETWTDCDTWFQGDWMAYMGNSREVVAWCDLPEPYEEEINEHS